MDGTKNTHVDYIIHETIQRYFKKNPEIFQELGYLYDELYSSIFESYLNFMQQINSDPIMHNLYQKISLDNELNSLFYEYVIEESLIEVISSKLNKSREEIIQEFNITFNLSVFSISTLISMLKLFFVFYIAYKGYIGRGIDAIKRFLAYISDILQIVTRPIFIADTFVKNIDINCMKYVRDDKIKEISTVDLNKALELIRDKFRNRLVGTRIYNLRMFAKENPEFISCVFDSVVATIELLLKTYVECLFNSEKFMDVISYKNEPIENIALGMYVGIVKDSCNVHLQKANELREMLQEMVLAFVPDKKADYDKKIKDAIKHSQEYAQKLLDEGKKKRDKRKRDKDKRDKRKKDRKRR